MTLAYIVIATLAGGPPAVLIAVLTIHTEAAFRKLCKVLGADCFFDKATEIDALLEAVRQHVALNAPIHSDGEGLRA